MRRRNASEEALVRCSSCEPMLDRFVDAALPAQQMQRVRDHVAVCTQCEALLTELRVVDALLATPERADVGPNFTFALMAEVRSMKPAKTRAHALWPAITFYLVAMWVIICGAIALFGTRISFIAAPVGSLRDSFGHAASAISGAAQALGPATPAVVVVVGSVLAIDAVLAISIVLFYRTVRPRLSARLANSETS